VREEGAALPGGEHAMDQARIKGVHDSAVPAGLDRFV